MDAVERRPLTLMEFAQSLVAVSDLRPEKAEQFVQDWLDDWAQLGEEPSGLTSQVNGKELSRLTGQYLAMYVDYLTPEQQVRFVRANLPKVIAQRNFQRCMSVLIERCEESESVAVLREACDAAELLTSDRLYAALGSLGGMDFAEVSNPWAI